MPLPAKFPIVLNGAPLTPPPPTGPHKPNLAIQARLAPELIAAIVDARKKGLSLQFEAYGPDAGFHIDGKHFPIHSVVAERTPHEVYAYTAGSQPTLQVIGKVVGRCNVQRTLTEGDQERLLQSRSAAENASARSIGRLDVPDVPVKGTATKRKPAVKKNVLTASAVADALRASPAPGTAGNSPPPTSRPATLDGPPNAFQTLLIHHLAYAPSTLQRLATAVKRQPKEIRGCLDSIATNDDSPTGPRPDNPTWTLKPSSYQYLRLVGSGSGGPWLNLSADDTKRMIADANRAFDELKLPPDAPARLALAAQQPAPPAPPPASTPKPQEPAPTPPATAPLKHPLPARPTPVAAAANGRLDVTKPSRVASPADAGASPRDTPATAPPPRPPVRVKDKPKVTDGAGDAEPKKNGSGAKPTKTSVNGKDKTKVKSKPIITGDSDGEDFVTGRERERKPPPPPAPARATAAPVAPVLHSRAGSSSSVKTGTESTTSKKAKRDADAALQLELEAAVNDSGFADSTRAPATTKVLPTEGKKRRMNEDDQAPRVRTKDTDKERTKEGKTGTPRDPERKVKTATTEAKRKRDIDQEGDMSLDVREGEKKKKRRADAVGGTMAAPSPAPFKRERDRDHAPRERERETDSSAVEARPKKPLPSRDPDLTPRVKEKVRKVLPDKANGSSASTSTIGKPNGSSKKERISVTYTSSEDEGTPPASSQRRAPVASGSGAASARPSKVPAPSPSEAGTPRDRDRERERDRERDRRKAPIAPAFVIPRKRPPLPENASAEDVRDRYAEVYADYMSLNARLSAERVKVQKLLKDVESGDHEGLLDASTIERLTKAYREAHEELTELKSRNPG
ncbi:hypothetical protein RhiLY_07430 [Ceratobasidium sp. AG-Ba]|nr:hypothetical protein RhiLY_07430 [Ceratobasidium sp. AG-Ba]